MSLRRCFLALVLATTWGKPAAAIDDYTLGPDSQVQAGVPKGEVTKYSWTSQIFPGTVRDYWIYVPAQYDGSKAAWGATTNNGSTNFSPRCASWNARSRFP